jgi:hypothetical protein
MEESYKKIFSVHHSSIGAWSVLSGKADPTAPVPRRGITHPGFIASTKLFAQSLKNSKGSACHTRIPRQVGQTKSRSSCCSGALLVPASIQVLACVSRTDYVYAVLLASDDVSGTRRPPRVGHLEGVARGRVTTGFCLISNIHARDSEITVILSCKNILPPAPHLLLHQVCVCPNMSTHVKPRAVSLGPSPRPRVKAG